MPHNPRPFDERTLDELEGVEWGPPTYDSHVVTSVHRLRRVPLNQYRPEDLRLMISQEVGLSYLVPRALDHLEAHPLASGDFYPGDLLSAVARVPTRYWSAQRSLIPRTIRVIDAALARAHRGDTAEDVSDELRSARVRLAALLDGRAPQ